MLFAPLPAGAQALAGPLRVGLALSGGSAKGFAHIGLLKVLEREDIPVHVVSGTSMGSIVGGLYALGVSVDSLAALAGAVDWDALFADRVERGRLSLDQRLFDHRTVFTVPLEGRRIRLPSGAAEGSGVLRMLDRLTWSAAELRDFRRLPRPFAAVATDLENGEAVTLTNGVLAHALRASMSLPGVLAPFQVGGRLLVDGGLARNLPAQDARALGADVVICSDVSDPLDRAEELESVVDVLMQTVSFQMYASTVEQRAFCDILLRPDVRGVSSLAFDRWEEWIARGEAAAVAQLPALRALARNTAAAPDIAGLRGELLSDSVTVARIELDGVDSPSVEALVRKVLGMEDGDRVTRDDIDAGVRDLYATDLFRLVRYRIDDVGGESVLSVDLQERSQDRLGLGFRYDDRRRSALLFTAMLHNRIRYGSATRLDVRLGEEMQLRGTYLSGRGVTRRFSVGGVVSWSQAPLDLYREGQRVARADLGIFSVTTVVGLTVGRATFAALEVRGERARGSTSVAATDSTNAQWLGSVAAVVLRETYDRPDFPTRGGRLYARSELGITTVATGGAFAHHVVNGRRLIPLHERVSLDVGFFVGVGSGSDLPFYRHFFMGGVHPSTVFQDTQPVFFGLESQEREGRAVQIARVGLQWEVREDRFITLSADAGNATDAWRIAPDEFLIGWAVSAGGPSVVGPISLTLSGGSASRRPRLSFSVGRPF